MSLKEDTVANKVRAVAYLFAQGTTEGVKAAQTSGKTLAGTREGFAESQC